MQSIPLKTLLASCRPPVVRSVRCLHRKWLTKPGRSIKGGSPSNRMYVIGGSGCVLSAYIMYRYHLRRVLPAQCQAQPIERIPIEQEKYANAALDFHRSNGHSEPLYITILWRIRVLMRAARLFVTFVPILMLYPVAQLTETSLIVWWRLVLLAVKYSGPTVIKLFQWASTRRDLFSSDFCERFAQLQRTGRSRPWAETEKVLIDTFGHNWRSLFRQFDKQPIGSGCVAQVFKAVINPIEFEHTTNAHMDEFNAKAYLPVAVKVTHASVIREIQMDMSILYAGAHIIQRIVPSLRYLSPVKCLEEFWAIMERQTDLRHEGGALTRFAKNFHRDTSVRFPVPILFTNRILIETFEEGLHISHFIPRPEQHTSPESARLNHHLAVAGVKAVCQMIFSDNFVHGDLHPGNILVQNHDRLLDRDKLPLRQRVQLLATKTLSLFRQLVRNVVGESELAETLIWADETDQVPDPTLVFLDTGITVELLPRDLENFKAVFKALLNADVGSSVQDLVKGELIGRLMISQSPHLQHFCTDPDEFCQDMQTMIETSVLKDGVRVPLREFDIGDILSQLLSIVSAHKVSLEPNFTSVILALMVLEGLGRSLDPDVDLLEGVRLFLLSNLM